MARTPPGGSELNQQGAAARHRESHRLDSPPSRQIPTGDITTIALPRVHAVPSIGHRILVVGTVLLDLAMVAAGTLIPSLLRYPAAETIGSLRTLEGTLVLVIGALVWIGMLAARGAYWPSVTLRRGYQAMIVISAAVPAWIVMQLAETWLKVAVPFESRLVMALSLPTTLLGLILMRLFVLRFLARVVYRRRECGPVLLLGDFDDPSQFVGEDEERAALGRPIIRHSISAMNPGRAVSLVHEHEAGQVILESESLTQFRAMEIAFACLDAGAEVTLRSAPVRLVARHPEGAGWGSLPSMKLRRFDLAGPEVFFKRFIDIVGSAVGLIVLSPVLLALAIAVKLSSPGPIIYKQDRVGRQGHRFRMYKFRTMIHGNDSREYETYSRSFIRHGKPAEVADDGTPIYKPSNDPRVTAVGAWMRRLSLDELPQLYNTLLGDMSLVGPRPCLPYEWDLYEPWQRRRLDVVPGCTGLWQVKGRSRVRFEEMVVLDLYYAHHGTLLSDLRLIAQTFPVMAQGRGAY